MKTEIICNDCLDAMMDMANESIDSIVTDPPYNLAFMGAEWDSFGERKGGSEPASERRRKAEAYAKDNAGAPRYAYSRASATGCNASNAAFQIAITPIFAEAYRVAKPGAYLLAFGGTRTYHRLACAIEDAGWEIRDCIMWVYGSGFPKSMDVGKAIDKALGAERKKMPNPLAKKQTASIGTNAYGDYNATTEIAPEPATEQAKEWDGWGTCLKPAWEPIIIARKPLDGTVANNVLKWGTGALNIDACRIPAICGEPPTQTNGRIAQGHVYNGGYGGKAGGRSAGQEIGRFPANLVHDGSPEAVSAFPDGAARFFYCAKASTAERGVGNDHPTVKPVALMRWLVRLVTRRGGVVLDPFCGSGTTGVAAAMEGMDFIGMEREAHFAEIARGRVANAAAAFGKQGRLL